mmetsp:Transcript_17610/g.44316  ORF Transcript_17610/g.44316 Transcript_17610/m.44316 type:complete len:691 (+) Transcript_17610:95-2167(+)
MAMRLAVVSSALFAVAMADSPIGKVLSMIEDLQTKILAEGESGQKVYAEFSEWCENQARELSHEIKTGSAEVDALKASIGEESATISSRTIKVEELVASIASNEADLANATTIRKQENTDFVKEEGELMETIDMITRASGIIEREMKKGGAAMLQLKSADNLVKAFDVMVQASLIGNSDAAKLSAFVQQSSSSATNSEAESDEEALDVGAPAGAVYESKSGDLLDTLQGLTDKAEGQLDDCRKKETSAMQNFEMLEQSLKDEIKFANKDMEAAKMEIAVSSEKKSTAEGDLEVTSKELATDIEAKQTLHHDCMTKAEDFESETKSRGEELNALAAAKTALKENTGGADDLSYGLNQVSFVQTGITSRSGLRQYEAARFMRDLARKHQSTQLAQLAARMTSAIRAGSHSGDDVFGKIKGLITDMIEKLEAEAEADATKKAYCDKELAETNQKKDEKTTEIEKMSTQIDQMSARSATLKEEVAALQTALGELSTSQAEMDKLRAEEKEQYTKNKADMEQGLQGIKMALKILNEYYAKEDKAHSAGEGAGTSIIGLLEVVESDFTKGVAEMSGAEENAVSRYEEQTKENAIESATKDQDVKYKTAEAQSLDKTISDLSSDRETTNTEHAAVMEFYAKIKERCIAKPDTYEERSGRRQAEIEGLKQALRTLEDETAFVQRKQRGSMRGSVLMAR